MDRVTWRARLVGQVGGNQRQIAEAGRKIHAILLLLGSDDPYRDRRISELLDEAQLGWGEMNSWIELHQQEGPALLAWLEQGAPEAISLSQPVTV